MKNRLFAAFGVGVFLVLAGCSSSHTVNEPTLSPLALQALQTREYETTKDIAFASVLSVLQDAGYIIDGADIETGFITASSPTDAKTTYDPFIWGFGKKSQLTKVTAFIESINAQTSKVRLNFVDILEKSKSYGINSRVDTPIEDSVIYENVFEEISKAIFVRQASG